MDLNSLFDSRVHVVLAGILTEHEIHGESSTWDNEDRHIAEKVGKLGRIHGGRCYDEFQILSAAHDLNLISKVK